MNTEKNMPVLFVGHGSPMNAIENNPARAGWKKMGKKLEKPERLSELRIPIARFTICTDSRRNYTK